MKQYIALVAFGLGIFSFAQQGARPGQHQNQPPKKMEHFDQHRGPQHPKPDFGRPNQPRPQGPAFAHQAPRPMPPQAPAPRNNGININVAIR